MIYAWCVERVEPDKLEQFLIELEAPMPGREKAAPSQRQVELEGADFMAAMQMHQTRRAG
jgi:hypothetical protein